MKTIQLKMANLRLSMFIAFLVLSQGSLAQLRVEGQLGGANLIGISLHTGYNFNLNKAGTVILSPNIGVGHLFTDLWVISTGFNLQYGKVGFGCDLGGTFYKLTNLTDEDVPAGEGFNDVYLFPNLNYTWTTERNWYFRLAFGSGMLIRESMAIPWLGFATGYTFDFDRK